MVSTRNEVLTALARAVRARRLERGLTIGALSEHAGLSPRFVAELESGRGNISVARLCDVARALGTTAARLLEGVDQAPARRIALLGLRGAGKSSIGPRLAERFEIPFLELDQLIERAAGLTLGELFELHGENFYRRLEREALDRLVADGMSAVIATGGSIVSDRESFELLRRSATTVWLKARAEDHMQRVLAQGDERPMRNRSDAMAELRSLLRTRAPLYSQADFVIDTSSLGLEQSVDSIVRALSSN